MPALNPDANDARQAGIWAYLPEEPLAGAASGPLSGLSFSAKDLFGVNGWPLHASSLAPLPPVSDSPLVARLLDLGATLVGKTHLHEIALGITGANAFGGTPNPLSGRRVTGGSSSGAAASAALALSDFALGTDTGGSIRVPAAWCGVYGFKPSKQNPLWSTDGVLPLSPTCDHSGPLALRLDTIVRVQEALSGHAVPPLSWKGLRVGLWNPEGWLSADSSAALEGVAARVESLGATLHRLRLPDMQVGYSDIVLSEAAAVHREALKLDEPGFTAGTLALLRYGAALSGERVEAARRQREVYRTVLDEKMDGLDVLLAPAVPSAAPLIGQDSVEVNAGPVLLREAVLRLTVPFSMLGWPVLTLPCQLANGLSVGVQLVGRPGTDNQVLGLGQALV